MIRPRRNGPRTGVVGLVLLLLGAAVVFVDLAARLGDTP